MTVVVTGAMTGVLEKLSRNQMNELIERAGGRSSSSVSKMFAEGTVSPGLTYGPWGRSFG
ncbi:MAG: hypothetical protein HOY79_22670 [Streptomyces sp.]|nr:hypothetical protein [Streptomyces sp.]